MTKAHSPSPLATASPAASILIGAVDHLEAGHDKIDQHAHHRAI